MAKSNNPYLALSLDRNKICEALQQLGAVDYSYTKNGDNYMLACVIEDINFRLIVHEKKDGTTTLQTIPNYDQELNSRVCEQIRFFCKFSDREKFQIAVPRFPEEQVDGLIKYLEQEGAAIEEDKTENHYRLTRLRSPQGDTLTIKLYTNHTFQLQGRWAALASYSLDYLTNVLPYKDAVKAQIDTFEFQISVPQAKNETEGKLPNSFDKLDSIVAAQLTSALIMTKIEMHLPDYGSVAFPALRGLEGFLYSELANSGLQPVASDNFGEYFEESKLPGQYAMRAPHAEYVGEPRCSELSKCYTYYNSQRHGIAHMSKRPEMSRMITDLAEARGIVDDVFSLIDKFYVTVTP